MVIFRLQFPLFLILLYGGNWNVPTIEKVRDIEIDICDNDDTVPR
jgi:hypothetical protein